MLGVVLGLMLQKINILHITFLNSNAVCCLYFTLWLFGWGKHSLDFIIPLGYLLALR